jgi:hypothetical protein
MRSRIARAFGFISKNGSSILAVSSVCIAIFSLYLTIQAQNDDRAYRELLIKPALATMSHTVDFSFAIQNNGLGPAQIKDIVYQFGGECISMLEADGIHLSQDNYYKVKEAIKNRLLNEIFSFEIPNAPSTPINTRGELLLPGSIIGPGKEVVLFRIDDSSLETFRARLNALELKLSQAVRDQFSARALTLPVSIKYCSMSGKYCEAIVRENGTDAPCKFR